MLLSISSSIVSSLGSPSNTFTIITTPGLPPYSFAMTLALGVLLILKDSLEASPKWNKCLHNSLNLAIISFSVTFLMVILFYTIKIIES
jgi:hypothetical protein